MIENLAEFYERIGRSDLAAEAYIKDKPYSKTYASIYC